jgi:protein ImuB
MTSRMAARLGARGEACARIDVTIAYDRSIARLRLGEGGGGGEEPAAQVEEGLRFHVDLPAPLSDAGDLLRPLKARLERTELLAPAVGLRVVASGIVSARRVQLDLSRDQAVHPDTLPALLAELSAEIGVDRLGVLEVVDAHRPEAQSKLVPTAKERPAPVRPPPAMPMPHASLPSRLLPKPVPLGKVGRGAIVAIDRQLYAIERMRFVMRLDGVEWWTASPASRDYLRAWLVSGAPTGKPVREGASAVSAGEAWIYVDRTTGEAFLQGWCE